MSYGKVVPFTTLLGKTLVKFDVAKNHYDEDVINVVDSDGIEYALLHLQDCCEDVWIESVVGSVKDLLNTPILVAEEVESDRDDEREQTHTFYKLDTIKGGVTIRWIGSSNGYYSESVSLIIGSGDL